MAEKHDAPEFPHQHTLPDGRKVALGRPTVKEDSRDLQLARYLIRPQLPHPADRLNLSHYMGGTPWGMYGNDVRGNCTAAGVVHDIMLLSRMVGDVIDPTQKDCDDLYIAVTGLEGAAYDPATGANDNGCAELDVVRYWRKHAIAKVILKAYAALRIKDTDLLRVAMQLCGPLYAGCSLPATAQEQVGKVWDDMGNVPGARPNSWGGHCFDIVDFDFAASTPTLTCVTWGTLQLMTLRFYLRYVDELRATLTSEWAERTPDTQFNFQLLEQDLSALGRKSG